MILCAGREHLREALSDCNRYVSLFHRLTAEDLFLVFLWCVLFCFFCLFLFGLCWFACERDLLVLTAVGQRQHAVFPHVLSQNDRHSCHGAYGNGSKRKSANSSFEKTVF